ncbi:galactose-specific lectin nattectin-like [Megalobrama amblycephala]|uniref:galactose-specific lectin nattectin-like n=1 Tax=Megalobrama amblycephala TaxID=75352 RepID=UPI002013FB8F|nr:galactose-specific lectin nattectin-like [Megalobrama amblycephala]
MAMLRSFLLLFIIFSMGNAEDDSVKKCPTGWTNFGLGWTNFKLQWRCFKYFSQPANWITAERKCQRLGANLASVHNKLEYNFLLSLLPPSATKTWVGGHDGVQNGQWLWSDGTMFDYINWCPGEPNTYDPSEICLEMNFSSDRCWNDATCSDFKGYFCVMNQ